MTCVASPPNPVPSNIVHAVRAGGIGYQLLCDVRRLAAGYQQVFHGLGWAGVGLPLHARVLREVDPIGRSITVCLTHDPIDCMSCLVVQAQT